MMSRSIWVVMAELNAIDSQFPWGGLLAWVALLMKSEAANCPAALAREKRSGFRPRRMTGMVEMGFE